MQTVRVMLLAAFFSCFLNSPSRSKAQTPPKNGKANQDSSYRFAPIRQVRKGLDAWPLILNANDATSKRLNTTLQEMNQKLTGALKACDANYREWAKNTGGATEAKLPKAGEWERRVEVTMTGPRYISIVAIDKIIFCGGAYPDSDHIAMVFDMSTGDPVNWTAMIAKTAGASSYTDSVYDGTRVATVIFQALEKISLAKASTECKDAFTDRQSFLIWPDAAREQLVALPFALPHVVQACAQEIDLTLDQARELGFDEAVIDSIQQAHSRYENAPRR